MTDNPSETTGSDAIFTFRSSGRRPGTWVALAVFAAALLGAWSLLDANGWIIAILAAFGLPAIYDLVANPPAGFTLTAKDVRWFSGGQHVTLPRRTIDHLRLDTRLDFSVRASLVLESGRKLRVPFEATPPHRTLEAAFEAENLRVKRFHFQLFQ